MERKPKVYQVRLKAIMPWMSFNTCPGLPLSRRDHLYSAGPI